MLPKHVDMSMLCRALYVVRRAKRKNITGRGSRNEAGITRIYHVLKVECSTFSV